MKNKRPATGKANPSGGKRRKMAATAGDVSQAGSKPEVKQRNKANIVSDTLKEEATVKVEIAQPAKRRRAKVSPVSQIAPAISDLQRTDPVGTSNQQRKRHKVQATTPSTAVDGEQGSVRRGSRRKLKMEDV